MEVKEQPKVIGNKSSGYNYSYASLADIANQGIEIPPMRVATLLNASGDPVIVNGQPIEYIEVFVDGEWQRGARIVIPSATKMNEAQTYGSALTYARRYSVLTLKGIATDDDSKIESHSKEDEEAKINASKEELKALYDKAEGADFDKWFTDNTKKGFTAQVYANMKATLLKQIDKKAEEKA